MKRIVGLTLSGLLMTGVFAQAQAPVVKIGSAEPPVVAPVPAPMPIPTAPATPAPDVEAPAAEAPKEEEKFILQKLLESSPAGQMLSENGWKVYGWTQGSFTTGSVRRSSLPVPFTDRIDKFSLNQNWLHVEKSIDTSKKEFQLGGTAELLIPGTDYRFTPARGLLTRRQARGETYGIDLYQAYADLFVPMLADSTIRVGKFATPIGYEVVQGISNPFVSRSYNFQYNPFTHTGVTVATPLGDDWSMLNGIVLGNDNFFGSDTTRATYLGQLKWAPKEGKNSVAFTTSVTNPTYDSNKNFNYYNVYNLLATHKFTDKLTYVADATFSHIDDTPQGYAQWYGLANYLLHDVTDKLQSKVRVELFNDQMGYRTGTRGLYTAATYGVTWKPTPYLYIMPEVRYDHNNKGMPFEGNNDMFTATIGAIVRW